MTTVPLYYQNTQYGCGWACIRMLLGAFGMVPSLKVKAPFEITMAEGSAHSSVSEIQTVLASYKISTTGYSLRANEILKLNPPSIIFLKKITLQFLLNQHPII